MAAVSTLNETVWPWSTLMSVENPWMALLPDPLMSHSEAGFPALVFSQATGLVIGASQGAAAAGEAAAPSTRAAAAAASPRILRHCKTEVIRRP